MPVANYLAALDTVLAVLLTFGLGGYVGHLRHKLKVEPPATTGHPQFERAFRAHANTVENLVLVLPLLWVASVFYGGQIPFWLGLIWVVSRIVYAIGYAQTDTRWRGAGGGIGLLALLGLLALSVIGLI
jgi:glutathione S-transferase